MEIKDTKNTMDIIPVSGVTIEIGGFQTMTDANGNYELNFRSEIIQGIPVILHQKDREVIDRISFGCKKFVMHKDFTFR